MAQRVHASANVNSTRGDDLLLRGRTDLSSRTQNAPGQEVYGIMSTIGDGSNAPGCSGHKAAEGAIEYKTFSKSYISYIGNNMGYEGFKSESWFNWKASYDEGYHFIPWASLAPSFSAAKWNAGAADADAYSVVEMGFEISDICQMTTKTKSVATATEIESDMNPIPTIMMMHDPWRHTDMMRSNTDNTKVFTHNNNFQDTVNPTTQDASILPRCKFGFDDDFLKTWSANTGGSATAPGKYNTVDFFQDFPIQKFKAGQIIGHSWKGPSNWYPLGKVNRQNPAYANQDTAGTNFKANIDLTQPTVTAFGETMTPLVGMLDTQGSTQMNTINSNRPEPVYIKVYPYVGKDGPIDITCQIEIRYHMTIAFRKRMTQAYPYPLLKNPVASLATAAAGNYFKLANNAGYTFNNPDMINYPLNMFNYQTAGSNVEAMVLYGPPQPNDQATYQTSDGKTYTRTGSETSFGLRSPTRRMRVGSPGPERMSDSDYDIVPSQRHRPY